jgi:phospholipid/cholesterol/gamma-HCH transport system permease protein
MRLFFELIGQRSQAFFEGIGGIGRLTWRVFLSLKTIKREFKLILEQGFHIGNKSIMIASLTAIFAGMVIALQFGTGLERFGAKLYIGGLVAIALFRELGPVLTALMVGGRVGSGIAAEIGSMNVTEQVDAIRAMGADPVEKLVLPRVIAAIIMFPLLTILSDVLGLLGGMVIGLLEFGISPRAFLDSAYNLVEFSDLYSGIGKTFFFGYFVAIVACYQGLKTTGGTVGVGRSTTVTVVIASILILVSDFFLTKIFLVLF